MAILTKGLSGGGGTGTGTSGTSGTSGSSGTSGTSGSSGSFTTNEQLTLELELAFKTAKPTVKKQFSYDTTSGNLQQITIFEYDITSGDSTAVLFTKVLQYNVNGNLIKITITRTSDNSTLVKDLNYDINGNITTIISVHNST